MSNEGGNKRFCCIGFTLERAFTQRGFPEVEKGDPNNMNGVELVTLVELLNI